MYYNILCSTAPHNEGVFAFLTCKSVHKMIITGGAHLASPKKIMQGFDFPCTCILHEFCGIPSNFSEERSLETIVNEQSSRATADLAKPINHPQTNVTRSLFLGWVYGVGERHYLQYCTVNLEIFVLTIFLYSLW